MIINYSFYSSSIYYDPQHLPCFNLYLKAFTFTIYCSDNCFVPVHNTVHRHDHRLVKYSI